MATRGGRIAPDGRPMQAKGVGQNAKRHDLERPATPGLHGSDLQYGDVQAMEQGQRIAPARTQRAAAPQPNVPRRGNGAQPAQGGGMQVPDAISFLSQRNGQQFNVPQPKRNLDSSPAMTWLPILRQLANGPGASSALVNAFINQARRMQMAGSVAASIVDMHAVDDGIEEMLNQGLR